MRNLVAAVEAIDPLVVTGKVAGVSGLLIESRGGLSRLAVGARAEIERRGQPPLPAAVVGFRAAHALLMPFRPGDGVAPLKEILRELRRIGYRGVLSLELFNRDYWKQDALTVARTGLEKMKAVVRASAEG